MEGGMMTAMPPDDAMTPAVKLSPVLDQGPVEDLADGSRGRGSGPGHGAEEGATAHGGDAADAPTRDRTHDGGSLSSRAMKKGAARNRQLPST